MILPGLCTLAITSGAASTRQLTAFRIIFSSAEQQLAEDLYISSQVELLNVIAKQANRNPRKAFTSLQELLPHEKLHPKLHYLESCVMFYIARNIIDLQPFYVRALVKLLNGITQLLSFFQ